MGKHGQESAGAEDEADAVTWHGRMYRKRSFATHRQKRLQASAAVCRIPCLILCLAYVERVCQCRGARHQRGPKTRRLVILW